MINIPPNTYLYGLTGLLAIISILVGRQLLKVRGDEIKLINLEKKGFNNSSNASELYELASVQLRKRLYPQATGTLKKAIKALEGEPAEAQAIIENALGFSLAAQDKFEAAITHYKTAIKAKPNYPVAMNNLGFAKQRLMQNDEAAKIYKEVLSLEPKNKTAIKQLKKIESKISIESEDTNEARGF